MPRGGAQPGAGRKPGATAQLRAMQRLNIEVKRDIDAFKSSLKAGFAEGIGDLAANFPQLVRLRIEHALAGDSEAADKLIALFSRFFQPDTIVTETSTPIAEYARQMRDEMLAMQEKATNAEGAPNDPMGSSGQDLLKPA